MEEQDQNEKKTWLAPVIEELEITKTMSGFVHESWTEDIDYSLS